MRVLDPQVELSRLWRRSAPAINRLVIDLFRKKASGDPGEREEFRLGEKMAETMAVADLIGRRRLLLEADAADVPQEERDKIVFGETEDTFPNVPFVEGIVDLVSREPRLAATAAKVAELYKSNHAFAMVNSANVVLTKRIQMLLAKPSAEPITLIQAVSRVGNFARAYTETVYRTNLTTAYTAGRFEQARRSDVARVIAGFERYEIMDGDVRRGRQEDHGENHAAGHGLIAATNDPIWEFASPPAGYNCRGGVRFMSRRDLKDRGLLTAAGEVLRRLPADFASYRPHPRFRTAAHTRIYRAA